MNFARKQLEKYGWKDGDGLGKTSQGIAVAIKPKLKTGKEGMGFDLCQELTGTWWTKAYSDSLSRINVKESAVDGEPLVVAVSIQEDDEEVKGKGHGSFAVAVERPMEKMRKRMMKANFTSFSKGGTLSNGELVEEEAPSSESNSNSGTTTPVIKFLNDEELLKACGGRTAHKAARFGLKLNGKLARIAAQEQIHLISIEADDSPESIEEQEQSDDVCIKNRKKSKKKRKYKDANSDCEADDTKLVLLQVQPQSEEPVSVQDGLQNTSYQKVKKSKKLKVQEIEVENELIENPKKKKKSKGKPKNIIDEQES